MVNTDDFIKRLEFLMENYALNASAFADKIGVQRSSISHLLSGRNKPSLDFVLKIQEFFPQVNLYWILNGREKFLKVEQDLEQTVTSKSIVAPTLFEKESMFDDTKISKENISNISLENNQLTENKIVHSTHNDSNIFKIVIFYTDGTFKDFQAR